MGRVEWPMVKMRNDATVPQAPCQGVTVPPTPTPLPVREAKDLQVKVVIPLELAQLFRRTLFNGEY